MQAIVKPQDWEVWLDKETNDVVASEETSVEVLEYLSRDDLLFRGAQYQDGSALVSGRDETRGISTCPDLLEILESKAFKKLFETTGYEIDAGPEGSRDWP